ncbi:MAG TPA: response regulator [Verrucomicrobiales bacterium]|jgi:PAS domain S-box-containing protein|nr:response regulator [Verrucomicrobiales bacterium]
MSYQNPLRILVVEDESLVARDLHHTLVRAGYEVTSLCRTGAEAIEAVKMQQPDVVLMDIHLAEGDMDGVEAAGKIHRDYQKPVVFLTGHADDQTTERARTAQPYGYLLKPFHESELRSVVELAASRHRADRQLRASEERFVSTLRSMAEGVISTDVLGVVNFMNPVAEKLTGWPAGEAAGRPLHEIFRVSLPGGEAVETSGLMNGGGSALRTMVLTDKDGASIPIEDNTTPIRDADGALTGIVVLFRRKEGAVLPPSLPDVSGTPWPNLAGIVSSISDPLLALDENWRITYLNNLAARVLDGRRESLLNCVLWDCLPASLHRLYYHEFSTAMSKRQARSFEMENEARGHWYEVQLYPFGPGLLALLREVTARKLADEQQDKLEKLESLGLLARGFAHDFNNLLTVLLGNLSLAEMNLPSESAGHNELRTARQATVQAQNLVQQLLTFARGGAPIRQPTDIGRLVQEWFAEWPKRPGIDYRMGVSGDIWQADVDRHQIRRLLSNLMKNAEQAVGREGIVTLRLARPVHVGLTPADLGLPAEAQLNDWILLEMVDNGEGIAPEQLERVFEPYFTTRPDANASGLGLTVCESIAKGHGGAVRLLSAWHEGTRVRISLPATSSPAQGGPSLVPDPANATPHSRRVLILEDEPLIRQLIALHLTNIGCEVTQTSDGSETVARYHESISKGQPYDLLVMDLSIPGGMGGAAAMEKIRQMDPGVRAIVSSGYSDDPVMSRYLDYGFRAVLPKPYQPQELRELVEELLQEGR